MKHMKHMGKLAAGFAAAMVLAAPFAAGALTVDEIQAKIAELLRTIAALQEQIKLLKEKQAQPPEGEGIWIPKHRICSVLNRNLLIGLTGDDVMSLQEFLQGEGYLIVTPTGYYGQLTADAVAKWQMKEGVTAVGSFGPLSRERLRIWCGGGGWINKERFSASPTRGDAPLTVIFSTWIGGLRPNLTTYYIDFGDGSPREKAAFCSAPLDYCQSPGQNVHTYTGNGSFTAMLVAESAIAGACTPGAADCGVVAKQQITVGPVACTMEYNPICGAKPIVCITTPCNPIPTTYSNRCAMNADGATFLYAGECRPQGTNPADDPQCKRWREAGFCSGVCHRETPGGPSICAVPMCAAVDTTIAKPAPAQCLEYFSPTPTPNPADDPRCQSWFDGCNTCSRQSPGSPAMCTLMACMYANDQRPIPYCKSYFGDTGNKPPVISGISGPTTLNVNQIGTWKVEASDPENGSLSYKVQWGDEMVWANSDASASIAGSPPVNQASTFTHTYTKAGTYTVVVVVTDSAGQSARTSTTVKVGDATICTMEYAPVCGRKPGCVPCNSAPGTACPAICQFYPAETFSNRCHLNAAGAELLYSGQCTINNVTPQGY